jgi:hypothetical protein
MARPKVIKGETTLLHITITKEMHNHLKMTAASLSLKEGRQITTSEVVRLALEKCYPLSN